MIEQNQIDLINKKLGKIPDVLYHGRYACPATKAEITKNIKIFENYKEIKGMTYDKLKNYGRTHLDCAFHGFYLTPCLGQALYWALTKPPKSNKIYQIIKVKKIKDISNLKIKINIVPDLEWVDHIVKNRGKLINYNPYDIVYNYIADGIMTNITSEIKGKTNYDKKKLHKKLLGNQKDFLDIYYDKNIYSSKDIIDCLSLNEYKHYQLCISSNRALQYFEINDIINLPNDYIKKNELNSKIDIIKHIKDIYGYNGISEDIINKIK